MRYFKYISLVISLLIIQNYGQDINNDFICGTSINLDSLCGSYTPPGLENNLGVYQGGRLKTAQGVLKVLWIYVRFSDDNYDDNNYWPNPEILPSFLQNSVNTTIPQNNIYSDLNVSNYIDRASGGNGNGKLGVFQMIGNVYYITLPYPRNHYNNDGDVNYAVFDTLDDPEGDFDLNFRIFDNWLFRVNNQNYKHSYVPYDPLTETGGDGKIDHVFIYWRDRSFSTLNPGGYAGLGLPQTFNSNDGVDIRSEDGTTQFHAKNYTPSYNGSLPFGGAIHEYGHFLFGGSGNTDSHFDGRSYSLHSNDNHGNIHSWAKMLRVNDGNINSYERYRLKWLYPSVITTNNSSIILKDTYVENKAIMIPIRYNSNNKPVEFFWIENFHTIAHYTNANPFSYTTRFDHTFPHGLLIFHIRNEDSELPTKSNIDLVSADGNWNWGLTAGSSTPTDRSDDQIDRISVNRSTSGLDEKDWIPLLTYNDYRALKPTSCIGCNPQHGWRYYSDDWLGDEQDIWNLQNNNIFSRYSNPGTYIFGSNPVELGIEIKSYNAITHEYTLNIQFGYNNVISQLPPSKPQNLQITVYQSGNNSYPKLNWELNQESDVINSSQAYLIERSINGGNYNQIATVNGSTSQYIDYSIQNAGNGPEVARYRIRAKDTQNLTSVYSDIKSINWHYGGGFDKSKGEEVAKVISEYNLFANYPNPFNPSTIINYAVKDAGLVNIKVYDILGSEVALLVNETKEAGEYAVEFNASTLPSGVYIYTMQVNGFTSSKKMLLMK